MKKLEVATPGGAKIKERSLGPPLFAPGRGRCSPRRACGLPGTAPMGVAGAPSARACCCVLCGAALQCRAPRCCVAVARSRTNAIVLCCGVLVCSAVLCCVHMCGVQGKSRALHNTICQRALSIVSAVRPTPRAMQHRQHRRIATSLLVASGDAVSHHVVCDGPLSSC